MLLYFVRHGESEANLSREFSNTGRKHPLTARGVAQAEALGAALAGRGIGRIYSSPLLRATQTAEIVARATGAPLETADALREWHVGIYEGTSGPEGWALHDQVQTDWFVHGRLESRMPGGESLLDMRARFVPFIEGLLGAADSAGDIVLVGHGGLYMAMLPVVMRNVTHLYVRDHHFANSDYALAELRADGLYCRQWCGAELP